MTPFARPKSRLSPLLSGLRPARGYVFMDGSAIDAEMEDVLSGSQADQLVAIYPINDG
jgi:hypothetical protein